MMEYLKTKITYPAQAKDEGIQGTVYIGFIVYKDVQISAILTTIFRFKLTTQFQLKVTI